MIVHKHLIVRAEVNKPPMEAEFVKNWLHELVDRIGMKVLSGPHAEYVDVPGNRGVTGVVIIETSHIALHVWDEEQPGLMQLDVYTCGPFDPEIVFDQIEEFDAVRMEYKYLDREDALIEIPVNKNS